MQVIDGFPKVISGQEELLLTVPAKRFRLRLVYTQERKFYSRLFPFDEGSSTVSFTGVL